MRFVSYKEIEEHCLQGCEQWERRTSYKTGRPYYYCRALQEPCFMCIDECKDILARNKELERQKTLTDF